MKFVYQSAVALIFMMLLNMGVNAQNEKKEAPKPAAAAAPASTNANNPNAPKIVFDKEEHNFGSLPEGPQATYEFKFTNTGKEPLILSNVKASCGCTTPAWTKEPVLPGKTGVITVTYNTQGRVGPFTKNITITSNADVSTKVIYIKGEVIKAEEEKSVPLAKPSMMAPKNN